MPIQNYFQNQNDYYQFSIVIVSLVLAALSIVVARKSKPPKKNFHISVAVIAVYFFIAVGANFLNLLASPIAGVLEWAGTMGLMFSLIAYSIIET